ncbi:copper chaperone PCu(A)C (plasmid) [Leisingera aquaemixtae]|uniref:Copper chaperone PCu(A)C n=1 Tax=Leisingera aquaemixtae TaxID=1396826 RepID=A0ABY5WRG5_9RHOB|nr:copper chaperone PCu(A)C [Leisingera aquaemixtae]UWQ43994.1 copper chaperone PCu(A)C [Leisingera aquaemixtae]
MKPVLHAALAALVLPLGAASAALADSGQVSIENAWSRASIGTSRPGAAYMEIVNEGDEAVTLTGIKTDIAMMPEIHRSSMNEQGVSSMAPAGHVPIAPGETVALEPGGLHAMLMKLQRPMHEGETFPLTLIFSDGGGVAVDVPVLGIAAPGPGN